MVQAATAIAPDANRKRWMNYNRSIPDVLRVDSLREYYPNRYQRLRSKICEL